MTKRELEDKIQEFDEGAKLISLVGIICYFVFSFISSAVALLMRNTDGLVNSQLILMGILILSLIIGGIFYLGKRHYKRVLRHVKEQEDRDNVVKRLCELQSFVINHIAESEAEKLARKLKGDVNDNSRSKKRTKKL